MTIGRCLDESALFALVDEPDANGAAAAHVASCPECAVRRDELERLIADLREPVRVHPTDAFAARLEAAIAAPPRPRRRSRTAAAVMAVSAALAIAATIVLAPKLAVLEPSGGTFAPRGGSGEASLSRDLQLGLDIVTTTSAGTVLVPVNENVRALPSAHLLVSYATIGATRPVHLLCYAIDARGEIHWLYPAFEDASSDPPSAVLLPGRATTAMPTEAALEDMPAGPLRVFALLSPEPMHVSDIERLEPGALSAATLTSRFDGIDVRTWALSIDEPREGGM